MVTVSQTHKKELGEENAVTPIRNRQSLLTSQPLLASPIKENIQLFCPSCARFRCQKLPCPHHTEWGRVKLPGSRGAIALTEHPMFLGCEEKSRANRAMETGSTRRQTGFPCKRVMDLNLLSSDWRLRSKPYHQVPWYQAPREFSG